MYINKLNKRGPKVDCISCNIEGIDFDQAVDIIKKPSAKYQASSILMVKKHTAQPTENVCKECGAKVARLRDHIRDIHEKRKKCEFCQKSISHRNFKKHQKDCKNKKKIKCKTCGKTFTGKRYLTQHKQRKHIDKCEKCEVYSRLTEPEKQKKRTEMKSHLECTWRLVTHKPMAIQCMRGSKIIPKRNRFSLKSNANQERQSTSCSVSHERTSEIYTENRPPGLYLYYFRPLQQNKINRVVYMKNFRQMILVLRSKMVLFFNQNIAAAQTLTACKKKYSLNAMPCHMHQSCKRCSELAKIAVGRAAVVIVDVLSGRLRELKGASLSQGFMGGQQALVADEVTATMII
ncbi:unnamed protein product [Trichogramma brassicae]|uniref:C2H2-type domain-containing protein n=1 Tax=Trichogramma brassicae TaxID=86971 RepID=A0A6H5I8W3_9HYME|nr:unnamed protein product [Trichogramma brassicae]